ncbi:hypothetical protein QT231_09860 [Halomonas sp. SpR1]|nr:hypothetical protein [Halomonas sp. SpR1]MDQ7733002.1 hypothetical protein [Halomonas sp. SpR1]
MTALLRHCTSIKAARLFLALADHLQRLGAEVGFNQLKYQ